MRRRLIAAILLVILGFAGLFVYAHFYFFPHKFKGLLLNYAQQTLKRKITLGDARFDFFSGVRISQLTIFEKNSNDVPFFHADEFRCSILFAPLLQAQKIVIPSVTLRHPAVRLVHEDANTWNFSDLLPPAQNSPPVPKAAPTIWKNNFDILLGSIQMTNGEVQIIERTGTQPVSTSMVGIELRTDFSMSQGVHTEFNARIPQFGTSLNLNGNYSLSTHQINAHLTVADLQLEPISNYLKSPSFQATGHLQKLSADFAWQNNSISGVAAIDLRELHWRSNKGKSLDGDFQTTASRFAWDGKTLQLKTDLISPQATYTWNENRRLQGEFDLAQLTLRFADRKLELSSDVQLRGGKLQVGPNFSMAADLGSKQTSLSFLDEDFQLAGDVDLTGMKLAAGKVEMSGNFQIPSLHLRINQDNTVVNGDVLAQDARYSGGGLTINGNATASEASVSVLKDVVDARMNLALSDSKLALNSRTLSGSPQVAVRLTFDASREKPFQYEGTMACRKESLSGFDLLGEVTGIHGDINFKNDDIESDNVGFDTTMGSFALNGLFKNFEEPFFRVRLTSSDIKLAEVQKTFSEAMAQAGVTMDGQAELALDYQGLLKDPKGASIAGKINLHDVTLTQRAFNNPATNVSGQLDYAQDFISWTNLHGKFHDEEYTFNGSLEHFSRPAIKATLRSDRTDLQGQCNLLHDAIQVVSLSGRLMDTRVNLHGDIHLLQKSVPNFDVRGDIDLDLKNVPELISAIAEPWKTFKPNGVIHLKGLFQGAAHDWRNWSIYLEGESPEIALHGYRLKNSKLRFEMRDQNVSRAEITGNFYDGSLAWKSSADLTNQETPFMFRLDMVKVDLGRLKKDAPLKNEDLSGKLNGFLAANGKLSEFKNLEGNGEISITDGKFWQLNLLQGLGKFLFIPEFQNIVFTEGSSQLTVKKERVEFHDLVLKSDAVHFNGDGWIGFNSDIRFSVYSQFNSDYIRSSPSLKKALTTVLTSTEDYLNIRISGTLQNPKYFATPTPVNVLEKARDLIKEGLNSIF